MPKLKQATISSLKGVVVVEDFIRYKNVLDNPNESDDYKLNALNHLKQKKPAKEIIINTGIGTTLKTLINHPNEDIKNEVKKLCESWDIDAKTKHQPTIEVKYDNLTLHIRRTSVKFFLKELGGEEEDEKLADIVEKEIFHKCKRLISKSYRKTVRKIIFVLRHESSENSALKQGKISPTEFVRKYLRTA